MEYLIVQDQVSGRKRQISRAAFNTLQATGNKRWLEVPAEDDQKSHPALAEGLENATEVITTTGKRKKV